MRPATQIRLLKCSIILGLLLFALGFYLHNYSDSIKELGVTGIIISAACVAGGIIFSLPTKIYLTILLMNEENKSRDGCDNAIQK
ncbi:hypothetical protein CW745_06125 [Psychromonas sp. psych-6C06]|uniref:hypothetical protein n=1 Tax=Psychromonas sp. psych-6C06 TaxID=2058089 RepID=UPI000C32FD76|nr:hypothetical protein [Psychromonas sp. psych-6C06]PKF63000.1 hypothetical protein CW745_06125 [Psychromonas sp. psych-6C06]